jgi:hypothetical protein
MRAVTLFMLLTGAMLISRSTIAADLPIPAKQAGQSNPPSPEEQRRQLLEEFLQFLKERSSR